MNISGLKGTIELANGTQMPYFGLGVFLSKEGNVVEQAVKMAIEAGYRHIDTASIYKNEKGVGRAIKASSITRKDIFITSKVWNTDQGYDKTIKAFNDSLRRLQTDYLDLYLIHWPVPGKFSDTWRAMEELYEQGKIKAIGVSNFHQHHLEELLSSCKVKPMVNQIEFHPRLVQTSLFEYCKKENIRLEAWSPIMRGKVNDIEILVDLAQKYKKTPAQIVLRWDLQKGIITIPKSVRKERIIENAAIFDFELSEDEIKTIDNLNRDERLGPDPDKFEFQL